MFLPSISRNDSFLFEPIYLYVFLGRFSKRHVNLLCFALQSFSTFLGMGHCCWWHLRMLRDDIAVYRTDGGTSRRQRLPMSDVLFSLAASSSFFVFLCSPLRTGSPINCSNFRRDIFNSLAVDMRSFLFFLSCRLIHRSIGGLVSLIVSTRRGSFCGNGFLQTVRMPDGICAHFPLAVCSLWMKACLLTQQHMSFTQRRVLPVRGGLTVVREQRLSGFNIWIFGCAFCRRRLHGNIVAEYGKCTLVQPCQTYRMRNGESAGSLDIYIYIYRERERESTLNHCNVQVLLYFKYFKGAPILKGNGKSRCSSVQVLLYFKGAPLF